MVINQNWVFDLLRTIVMNLKSCPDSQGGGFLQFLIPMNTGPKHMVNL